MTQEQDTTGNEENQTQSDTGSVGIGRDYSPNWDIVVTENLIVRRDNVLYWEREHTTGNAFAVLHDPEIDPIDTGTPFEELQARFK